MILRYSGRRVALRGALGAALAIGAVSLGSVASADAQTTPRNKAKAAKAPVKLTVGLPVVDASFIPVWIAHEKGFYRRQGLDVTIDTFTGGAPLTQAVVGGTVDIGVNGLGGIIPAISQGQPLKVIYGGMNEPTYVWIAPPSIPNIAAAAGKGWGVTAIGSDSAFMAQYMIDSHHLTGTHLVQGVVSAATAEAALTSGAAAVATVAADNDGPELAAGDHVIARESSLTKSYPDHMTFATESFIKQHPTTVTKFLRALSEAIAYEKAHPAYAEAAIVKYDKFPQVFVRNTYAAFAADQFADGQLPTPAGMKFFWHVGLVNKEFTSVLPESKWLDPHWIDTYKQWSRTASTTKSKT